MAYVLKTFNGVTLPPHNAINPVGTGDRSSSAYPVQGKVFDPHGSEQRMAEGYVLRKRCLIYADSPGDLRTAFNTYRALVGKKAALFREWGDGTREWVTARLLGIEGDRERANLLNQALDFRFEIHSSVWYDETQTVLTPTISTNPQTVVVNNPGNTYIDNPIFTLTVPGGKTLTGLTISKTGVFEISFTDTMTAAQVLIIDCGARSVTLAGADGYNEFALGAGHVISQWAKLEPGNNNVIIDLDPAGQLPVSGLQIALYGGWI